MSISGIWPPLTFAGIALPGQSNHQGRAVAALGGAGERLDAELVCFGLQGKISKTNQVTESQGEAGWSAPDWVSP